MVWAPLLLPLFTHFFLSDFISSQTQLGPISSLLPQDPVIQNMARAEPQAIRPSPGDSLVVLGTTLAQLLMAPLALSPELWHPRFSWPSSS